jgi:hypothetical protein
MSSTILSLLPSAGVAGVWLICVLTGVQPTKAQMDDKEKQIEELKEAVRLERERADAERRRADSSVEAVNTANILLAGIRRGIGDAE